MEEVKIPITLDDSGFGTGAKRIIDRMEDTQKEVNKTGMSVDYFAKHMQNVYRHFDKLTAAVHENTAAIGKDSQATRQLGREFDETADKGVNGFGRLEKAAIGFFTIQKAKEFVGKVYDVRSEIEKLETSFRILVGDKAKADALFASIRKFAVETPMQLKDLAGAAQTMMGFGIATEDVMANLEALGNVSMGDSQKFQSLALAFSQMSATGKLMGQDLLQMINAGFNPLDQMAKTTGKSIAELKEEMSLGAISADMVRQAFIDATSEGGKFNGMLEAQSKNMAGAYSNLEGAVDDMLNEIGQKSEGAFAMAIEGATDLVKNYDKVASVIQDLIVAYGSYKAALMVCNAVEKASVGIKQAMAVQEALLTAEAKKLAAARGISLAAAKAELGGVNLLTVAKIRLTAATKSLTAAMMANPYVLVSMAVAGLCFGIYKLATAEDAETAARRRVNEEMKTFQNQLDEQKNKIQGYIQTIQDETATEYQKAEAWEMLNKMAPTLTEKYDRATLATMDLAEANKELTEQAERLNYEHLREEVIKWSNALKQAKANEKAYLESTSPDPNGVRAQSIGKSIEEAQAKLDEYAKKLAEINRIRAKMAEDAKPIEIRIKEANENVQAKQEIYDFYKRAADLAGELKNAHDEAAGVIANSGIPYNYEAIADQTKEKYDALIAELEADVEDLRTRIAESPASLELEHELKGKEKALDDLISMKQQWAWSGATTIPLNFVMNFSQVETALQNAKNGQGINTQGMRFNGPTGTWVKDEATAPATMTASQWRKDAYNNWKQAQAAVDAFWNKKEEMDKETFDKEYKSLKDAADQAKKDYDKLKGSTNGNSSAARKAAETARKHQAYLDLIEKQRVEQERAVTDMEFSTEQATIDAMQDGAEKTLRQLKLDHEKRKEEIEREYADLKQAKIDAAKQLFEANTANNGKVFDASSVDTSYSEKEQANYRALMEANNATYRRALEDRQRMEAQAMLDYLKQYGDYEQQKFAITKEFEEKIRNAASPTEAASLTLQRDNDIEKLSAQQLQEKIDWSGVFNDLDGHSKEYLGKLRDQLQGLLKDGDLPVDQMAVVQGKIQEINAALNKQSGLFGHVSDLQQEHNRRLQQAADAQDRLNRAKQEETAATKRISDVQQKIQDLLSSNGIDTDVDMDDDLARVFDANSEEFKQMNDLLTQLCTNEGELAEARKKTGEATQEAKDAEDAAQESLEQAVARHLGNVNEWTQKYLGDLPGLLDKIGLGDIGEKVQQGMNGINNAANAAADFTSGNFVGAAMNGISALQDFGSMFGLFGSSNHEEMLEVQKEANDKLDLINDKVGRISDKLDKSYGVEAVRTYEELKDYIDSSQEQFHRGVIAAGDDNYDGGHSEWWHRNKNGGEGVDGFVARLKEYYHLDFSGTAWQDFFNYIASLEEGEGARILNDLRENSSMQDIWEELMRTNSYDEGAIAGWVSRWADSYDDMADAIDQLNERLTTTTKENVFDDFLGYLYDFANGVEDVTESAAEDWREMVNRMVINNRIAKDLQESLNGWYDELAQLTKEYAEGGITSEEYARRLSELRKQYDSYMNDAQSQIEQYTEMGIIQPIDKAAERMKELVSDMAGSVRNAFQQLLDGTVTDVERWGRDLRRTMATQLIESLLFDEAFEKWSENMAERFKGITQAFRDGRFDDDTYRRLTGEWSDQVGYKAEDIREQVEDMMKALGLSLSQDDTFRGMGDSWVSMLTDMGIAADDWAEEIGQVMAQRIIQQFVVANMMQPLLDRLQDEFDRASAEEGATWQAIIADENVKAVLDEIKAAYPELQDTVRSIYEALGLSLGEGLGDLTDTFVSSLTNLDGKAGDIGKSVGKKMIEQMIAEIISKKYSDQIEDISRRWQEALDSEDTDAIAALREELEALYQTIGDDDAISQLKEELKELGRSNPFESLRSSFVTSLMDIKSDAQHFASDIGQLLTESFIDRFVLGDEFDKRLAEWQEQYASIMRGNYSEEERARLLKELQAAIAAAKEGYAEEAQAIHDLMGTGNASDQTATANMADKATYEQFETYLGIAVAQQMATLQGNDVREQILATLRGMTGITSPGGDTVKEIRSLLNTSNEYLLDIKRTNRAILEQFGMKIDNIISKLTKLV